jgi:Secretion system C-terminal sorting domain
MKQLTTVILFLSFMANSSAQFLIRVQNPVTNGNTFTCDIVISSIPDTRIGTSELIFSFNPSDLHNPVKTGGFGTLLVNGQTIFLQVNIPSGSTFPLITSTPTLLMSLSFERLNFNNNNNDIYSPTNFTNVTKIDPTTGLPVPATVIWQSALPITLTKFQAQPTEEGNFLTWETGSEINTSHFDIEASLDGKKFGKIGKIESEGRAASYDFLDKQPLSNTVYYRLKSNDLDGQFQYSKVISISSLRQKGLSVKAFPNPFNQDLSIEISTSKKSDLTINIIDIVGRLVYQSKTKDTEGVLSIPISTDFLSSGSYFLNITDGEKTTQQKIVKF